MSLGNETGNSQGWLSRFFMIFIALVVIGPWQGAKALYKRIYERENWSDGLVYTPLAIAGSLYSSFWIGNLMRSHGHSMPLWLFCGFVALLAAAGYGCPILWLTFLKPIWHVTKRIWKDVDDFAQKHFETACLNIVQALPLSGGMWKKIVDPTRKSFFGRLVKTVMYPIAVLGSGYLGYSIYLFAHALSTGLVGLALSVAGGVVGFLVFASVADVLCRLVHYGKLPAVAILLSLAAAAFVGHFALAFGLAAAVIAFVVVASLSTAYLVPAVLLLFSDHFLNWVLTTLKPLLEGAYEQSENPARRLFGQTLNLVTTALAGWGTWLLCSAIALPVTATAPILLLTVALAYTLGGKVWDSDAGNYLSGSVLALVAGGHAFHEYSRLGFIGGHYAAIAVGVVAAFIIWALAYPGLLLGYQRLFKAYKSTGWLVAAHTAVWTKFEKLVDKCETVYYWGYRDNRGDFDKLVLHLFNGLVALALPVALFFGAHQFVMAHYIVSSIATVLLVMFSYVVGGHYILRSGVELVGGVSATAAAIATGVFVAPLQVLGWWLAGPLAVLVGSLVFVLFFPAGFIGARYVVDPTGTKFLLPIFAALYDRGWARFGKLWIAFVAVYNSVVTFLSPYWAGITGWFAAGWRSIMAAWDRMVGH